MSKQNSQAIIAKARAMYGKQIKEDQFQELIKCRTVAELAGYLKKQTHFSEALTSIAENSIHRGQLENLLRRWEFDNYAKLYRYLVDTKKSMFHYVIVQEEMRELLRMILLMKADNAASFIVDLPGYLISKATVDLLAVARATNFDELLAVLKGSDYGNILERYQPEKPGEPLDYAAMEHAFYEYYYKSLFETIKKSYSGTERRELEDLVRTQIEMGNLNHVMRATLYKNSTKAEAVKSLHPYYYRMSQVQFNNLLDIKELENIEDAFRKTPYAKRFPDTIYPYIEDYTNRILYQSAAKMIHFSTYASTVFYAYFLISQAELGNVINVVEGIRYQVPEDEIRKLIIQS